MPSTREMIKAIPLADKPEGLSRCGMSQATFAQHRFTSQWYELSEQGQTIGSPIDLDFYRYEGQQGPLTRSKDRTQELSKV